MTKPVVLLCALLSSACTGGSEAAQDNGACPDQEVPFVLAFSAPSVGSPAHAGCSAEMALTVMGGIRPPEEHAYNEHGQRTRTRTQVLEGAPVFVQTWSYDDASRASLYNHEKNDVGVFETIAWLYEDEDAPCRVTRKRFDRGGGAVAGTVDGIFEFEELFVYEDARLVRVEATGADATDAYTIDFTYDADGRVDERILTAWDGVVLERHRYVYGPDGLLAGATWVNEISSETLVMTYEWDDDGNQTLYAGTSQGAGGADAGFVEETTWANGRELTRTGHDSFQNYDFVQSFDWTCSGD